MQRPVSQDETLDTNDVKNSSLKASNGKNMATLRAYDAIALEVNRIYIQIGNPYFSILETINAVFHFLWFQLCICVLMLLKKSARNISEVVQWRCLQTTTKFLPLIYTDLSHYYPGSIQQDINDLMDLPLSDRNSSLVLELLANFVNLKSTSN